MVWRHISNASRDRHTFSAHAPALHIATRVLARQKESSVRAGPSLDLANISAVPYLYIPVLILKNHIVSLCVWRSVLLFSKSNQIFFGYFHPFLDDETNNFRGDPTHISAKTEPLVESRSGRSPKKSPGYRVPGFSKHYLKTCTYMSFRYIYNTLQTSINMEFGLRHTPWFLRNRISYKACVLQNTQLVSRHTPKWPRNRMS